MAKTLLFIFNPKSGTQKLPDRLFDVVDAFTAAGFLVTVYPTQAAGELVAICHQLAADFDYLVVSGGDGTVSEAINALMPMEERPAFGFIPSGTVNDFAQSLSIPTLIPAAVDIILRGQKNLLDVGRFNDQHFIYVAAFGLFTDVSYSTSQTAKNWLGKLAYFLEGAKRIWDMPTYACDFQIDDDYIQGEFVLGVVANTHSIAGIKMPKNIDAHMDDGLFEVILVQKPEGIKESQEVLASLLAQEEKSPLVTIRKARHVSFHAYEAVPWTLDGDFGGDFYRAEVVNLHQAVEIIVGSGRLND